MRRFFPIVSCLGLAFALVVSGAQAGIIVDEDTQALPNETDTTLYLSKFDPALGTLTNVWVQVELRLSNVRVEMDNDATVPQEGTGRVLNSASSLVSTATLLKTGFDTINNGDLTVNESGVFPLTATTGDTVGAFNATLAGDYADWQPGTLTAGDSGNISSSVWSEYLGTGTFSVTVNTIYLTSATFEGSSGYFQGNTPNGELYAKVIYTYAPLSGPIPEPSTLSLLALGGLSLLRRHRR